MPYPPFRNPGARLPNTFVYEPEDEVFLEMLKPWNVNQYKADAGGRTVNNRIRKIKQDLKDKLFLIQEFYCAFCGIDLGIAREIHIEHIAPQSQHCNYIFEPENLVLACYDCNDFKGKNRTVDNNTNLYSTTTFLILHPYRDNYGGYLIAYYENGGLLFELLEGVTDIRATRTIQILGLRDTLLIKERGMRIKNALIPTPETDDELIRVTCSITPRKRS